MLTYYSLGIQIKVKIREKTLASDISKLRFEIKIMNRVKCQERQNKRQSMLCLYKFN